MNPKRAKRNRFFSREGQKTVSGGSGSAQAARFEKKPSGIGVRGLRHRAGRIEEEWRKEFRTWDKACKQFLEMRDYYIIATVLDAVKLPLLEARFSTEPAEAQTPGDIAAADWLFDCMNHMHRQTWASHTEDMLSDIEFGWALGEIVLEKRPDGRFWLRNIDPRGQDTLERWEFDAEHRDEVLQMIQRDPNSTMLISIPLAKCVHVTFRGRKGNPEGHSLLLSLHWPYRMLRDLEVFEGIGVERDVGGMPVAQLPEEGVVSEADLTKLEDALKGMRRDENEYLIAPPGVEIKPYSGQGTKMFNIGDIIDRKKKEILMRMYAQFLMLGMQQVGTQALVKGSQDFFNLALGAVQRSVKEAWNQQLVPYLFAFNRFDGMTDYPTIEWEKPGNIDTKLIVDMLNAASGARLFTPTDIDEDHLRELMDWPAMPDEERGQPREIEKPGVSGLFDLK
jgi:hypothetical protein